MSVLNSRITYRSWCDIQEGFSKRRTRSVKNRACSEILTTFIKVIYQTFPRSSTWIRVFRAFEPHGHVPGWNHTVDLKMKTSKRMSLLGIKITHLCVGSSYCPVICKMYYNGYIDFQYEFRPKSIKFDSSLIFVWYCLLSQFAKDECKRFGCKCNIVLMSNLVFVSSIYRKDVVKYRTGDVALSKHVVSISLSC